MIEVKNISKKFNNNVVLNGIDLNINKGDVVAIIGPSGTGKSTFLRCLNRLEKPESGSISIGDLSVDLARSDKKSLVELRKKDQHGIPGIQSLFQKDSIGKCNGRPDHRKENGQEKSRRDRKRTA